MDQALAIEHARKNIKGHAWREGLAEWLPIANIDELSGTGNHLAAPPPPTSSTSQTADEIDYKISDLKCSLLKLSLTLENLQ